jgi:raffinose/stachyose/melibiose transport system substrate-binding protein
LVRAGAKEFLKQLVTSEQGKQYITKEFRFIPAYKSIKGTEADMGQLGVEAVKYARKTNCSFKCYLGEAKQEFGSQI